MSKPGTDYKTNLHGQSGADTDCSKNGEVYIDLNENDPTERQHAIALMIEEATKTGLSDDIAEPLTSILDKYPVFDSD